MKKKETSQKEVYQKEWHNRIGLYHANGTLKRMIHTELFNLSWQISVRAIIDKLRLTNDQTVLDAGCGYGRILVGVKHYLPEVKIEAIDIVDTLVKQAQSLIDYYGYKNVHVEQGDVLDVSRFDSNLFDAIYSVRVMHYVTNKEKSLENLQRILKPCGKIIIIIPNRYCPYRWLTYHNPLYSAYKLKQLMKDAGFVGLQTGTIGFLPKKLLNLSYKSGLYNFEKLFQKTPMINMIGGLAYVFGQKKDR